MSNYVSRQNIADFGMVPNLLGHICRPTVHSNYSTCTVDNKANSFGLLFSF